MSESDLEKKKTRNVFILGAAFGLIFTGFLTIAGTAETILRSYQRRTGTDDLNAFLREEVMKSSFFPEVYHFKESAN